MSHPSPKVLCDCGLLVGVGHVVQEHLKSETHRKRVAAKPSEPLGSVENFYASFIESRQPAASTSPDNLLGELDMVKVVLVHVPHTSP